MSETEMLHYGSIITIFKCKEVCRWKGKLSVLNEGVVSKETVVLRQFGK